MRHYASSFHEFYTTCSSDGENEKVKGGREGGRKEEAIRRSIRFLSGFSYPVRSLFRQRGKLWSWKGTRPSVVYGPSPSTSDLPRGETSRCLSSSAVLRVGKTPTLRTTSSAIENFRTRPLRSLSSSAGLPFQSARVCISKDPIHIRIYIST